MTESDWTDPSPHRLDVVQLLDERFRLREDPERQGELRLTHERLRAELQLLEEPEAPSDPES
jgi:hypothetical protein